jgi:hypothetical protein
MVIVRDHLAALLESMGYQVRIDNQSIWENSAPPQHADLVFQLIPAFSPDEMPCPSISIRTLLRDLNDPETIGRVLAIVREVYPANEHVLN